MCVGGHEPTSQKLHDFRVGLLVGVVRTTKDRPQNIPQEGAVRGKSGATAWHNEATGDLMSHFSHLSSLIHMNPYVENAADGEIDVMNMFSMIFHVLLETLSRHETQSLSPNKRHLGVAH